ncbi:GNAT family protein [Microbacterium sp. H1-D42]|uniref:GNAT family N-acetyltransferase n=1 Tax=Microbacterium sp. H1-D42 TaxID=2925844 RepID=UPI001F52F098|nr:GNAT family protein [Microbacterium sp. H1-D42]UNK72551.1 GNAT family N-acetyltransferase [Microbacterium sp. H1-D42]
MGAGTSIRLLTLDDVADLTALELANREHLRPWDPARAPEYFTASEQRHRLEVALREHDAGRAVPFGITTDGGELIGRVTLSGVVRGALQSCAMGYWIAADHLRRGHAVRAAALAVEHAFTELKLHRVQAETLPENTPSQAVLERIGFTQYGLAPQYLRINGAWRDFLMFQRINPAID